MPVIQGGSIVYDANETYQKNIQNLTNAAKNAGDTIQADRLQALNSAVTASNLLNAEIQRSGQPASVFMSLGYGTPYLNMISQSMSKATGRVITGDEAYDAVNQLLGGAYDWNNLPLADRTTFLANRFGFQNENSPGSETAEPTAQTPVTTPIAAQSQPQQQPGANLQGTPGPSSNPQASRTPGDAANTTGLQEIGTSPDGDKIYAVPGKTLQQTGILAHLGAEALRQSQQQQPQPQQQQSQPQAQQQQPQPQSQQLQAQPQANLQAQGIPAQLQAAQAQQPQNMTAPQAPYVPDTSTQSAPTAPRADNFQIPQQLQPQGFDPTRVQGVPQWQYQPTITPQPTPSTTLQPQSVPQEPGTPISRTAEKVRQLVKSLGDDWSNIDDQEVIRRSMRDRVGYDADAPKEMLGKTLYQIITGEEGPAEPRDTWELQTPQGIFREEVPAGMSPSFEGGTKINKAPGGNQDYLAFEQKLRSSALPLTAQTGQSDAPVAYAEQEFSKMVGGLPFAEASVKYPSLWKLYQVKGGKYAKDKWQAYLNSNGLSQVPGGMFLDAYSGNPVEGPADSYFDEDFKEILSTKLNATLDAMAVDTTKPATNVKQAAAQKKAKDVEVKIATAKSPDELIYGKVTFPNNLPAVEPNWLEKNAPGVSKALDGFNRLFGEPTRSMKSKSTAYQAGLQTGHWLNAVWNKMTPDERKNHVTQLLDYARNADITTTSLVYGPEMAKNKLAQLEYQVRLAEATAVSDTAKSKLMTGMLETSQKNVLDTLQNMNVFIGHITTAAKNAGKEKDITSFIASNPVFDAMFKNMQDFMKNAAANSGYNMLFTELYNAQVKSGLFGWGSKNTYSATQPKQDSSLPELSAEALAAAKSLGLVP